MKRKSIDVVPIWFVSKTTKPEKCITGDTLAPEKKALMITGDARGSQRVVGQLVVAFYPSIAETRHTCSTYSSLLPSSLPLKGGRYDACLVNRPSPCI